MSIPTASTSDLPMSSSYDLGFDQSDMESSSSAASCDESVPKDYWFGRKYFECIIAQDVLQRSRLHDTVAHVDSRLESIIQQFPHARSLKELEECDLGPLLPAIDDASQHGAYRAMMFCIGAVVRGGNRAQKAALLTVLRRHISKSDYPDSSQLRTDNIADSIVDSETTRAHSPRNRLSPEREPLPSNNAGRYASALQNHGAQAGFNPVYQVSEVANGSPTFRASVLVNESLYEATGKTKKQARHEAAKKACLRMNIDA